VAYKKKPSHHHIGGFVELDGGGGYSGKRIFYKGVNQTENFTRVKTKNDIYYKGEKHY